MKLTLLALGALLSYAVPAWSYEDVPQGKAGIYGSLKNVTCPIEIRPGVGIGPLEVGHSLAIVESTGMELKTVQGSSSYMLAGRYKIRFDKNHEVRSVGAELGELPDCVYFGGQKIWQGITVPELYNLLPNCERPSGLPATGGNTIKCEGIQILYGGWGGTQETPALQIIRD